MKNLWLVLVFLALSSRAFATTWYVRPHGGTRYSSNQLLGQCNGLYDAAYPGTTTATWAPVHAYTIGQVITGNTGYYETVITAGTSGTATPTWATTTTDGTVSWSQGSLYPVNQNCAFNDFRYMWDDQSAGSDAWVMAGGDTVIIEGCAANANQISPSSPDCRIGWDAATGTGAGYTWCYGGSGYAACTNPTIPAGTTTQPTRILGENYANCSTGNSTNRSALTQIFGGFGVLEALNLAGAVNVDVECLEITEHNEAAPPATGTCIYFGSPKYPVGCGSSSDFDGSGILTSNTTSNVLLQDLYIHGHTARGIYGPIGGAITMNRVFIGFNGFAGWDFDNGDVANAAGSSINANYVTMEGNGCNEQYPIVNSTFPAESCYDLNSGGFGDSWSGQDTELDSFICNHCVQIYNTKDGFIGPHTKIKTLVIENSESIGNMGQQWKWNSTTYSSTLVDNTLTVGNCNRMSEMIPGAAQNFNGSTGLSGSYLSLFCRAAGDIFSYSSAANSTVLFANNTFVGYSATLFDMNCTDGLVNGVANTGTCGTTPYVYKNNIFLGYLNDDPTYAVFSNGELPAVYYYSDSSDVVTASNNIEYDIRNGDACGGTILCVSPLLVSQPVSPMMLETQLDNFNFYPSSTSPAIAAGTTYTGLPSTDYYGVATTSPNPVIGAVNFVGSAPSAAQFFGVTISGGVRQ